MSRRGFPSYHFRLVRHHGRRSGNNLRPRNLGDPKAAFEQHPHHMHAVVFERRGVLPHFVDNARYEASHANGLDIYLDELAELLYYGSCGLAQRKGLGWVEIEEDGDKGDGEDHVELVLRVNAMRIGFRLEWEREHLASKVNVCNIANAKE